MFEIKSDSMRKKNTEPRKPNWYVLLVVEHHQNKKIDLPKHDSSKVR